MRALPSPRSSQSKGGSRPRPANKSRSQILARIAESVAGCQLNPQAPSSNLVLMTRSSGSKGAGVSMARRGAVNTGVRLRPTLKHENSYRTNSCVQRGCSHTQLSGANAPLNAWRAAGEECTAMVRRRKKDAEVPDAQQNAHYRLEEVYIKHRVQDVSSIRHTWTRRDTVVLQSDGRFYERRFVWTGTSTTENHEIQFGSQEHKVHGPVVREALDTIVLVDLGQTWSTGSTMSIETSHSLLDEGRTFEPRVMHRVTSETGKLTIEVNLPEPLWENVHGFAKVAATNSSIALPIDHSVSEDLEQDLQFMYRLHIPSPRMGHIYGVGWLH